MSNNNAQRPCVCQSLGYEHITVGQVPFEPDSDIFDPHFAIGDINLPAQERFKTIVLHMVRVKMLQETFTRLYSNTAPGKRLLAQHFYRIKEFREDLLVPIAPGLGNRCLERIKQMKEADGRDDENVPSHSKSKLMDDYITLCRIAATVKKNLPKHLPLDAPEDMQDTYYTRLQEILNEPPADGLDHEAGVIIRYQGLDDCDANAPVGGPDNFDRFMHEPEKHLARAIRLCHWGACEFGKVAPGAEAYLNGLLGEFWPK